MIRVVYEDVAAIEHIDFEDAQGYQVSSSGHLSLLGEDDRAFVTFRKDVWRWVEVDRSK